MSGAYERRPRTFAETMNPAVIEKSVVSVAPATVKITVRVPVEVHEAARRMSFETKVPMAQLQLEGLRHVLERNGYL